jgi:hypothetical protein
MEEEPKEQKPEASDGEEQGPPPFEPDPELVTYIERGRRDDAPEKFRRALEDLPREPNERQDRKNA